MIKQFSSKLRASPQHATCIKRDAAARRRGFLRSHGSNQAYESLEKAVQTLNKVISVSTRNRNKGSTADGARSPAIKKRSKAVAFIASFKAEKMVQEFPSDCKSLQAYLALPIDQYSVLDPRLIKRDDEGRFHVTLPLIDIVGLDLTPGVFVKVDVDPEASEVRFTADQFTLGEPRLDQEFTVSMHAVLSTQGAHSIDVARVPADAGAPVAPAIVRQLACSVDVNMALQVPHPLAIAPKPMLNSLGSLVMKMALQSLLPNFLDLLVVDYNRWAEHKESRDQPAGSLISE